MSIKVDKIYWAELGWRQNKPSWLHGVNKWQFETTQKFRPGNFHISHCMNALMEKPGEELVPEWATPPQFTTWL